MTDEDRERLAVREGPTQPHRSPQISPSAMRVYWYAHKHPFLALPAGLYRWLRYPQACHPRSPSPRRESVPYSKACRAISRRDIALMSSSRIWDEPEHQLPDLKGMVATAPDHLRCATSTPNVGWGHLTLTTASLTKFALILVPKTLRGVGVADLRRVQFS
jgi:hypothetical protein